MVDTLVVVAVVAGTVAAEVGTGTGFGTEAVPELSLVALGSVEDSLRKDNRIMIINLLRNTIEYCFFKDISCLIFHY